MSENSYVTGLFYIINSFDKTRLCKNFFRFGNLMHGSHDLEIKHGIE